MNGFSSLLLLFVLIAPGTSFSQKKTPLPFDSVRNYTTPQSWENVSIKEISGSELLEQIQNHPKKLNWVVIYTVHCSGTEYMMNYIKEMQDKYRDSIEVYLLSSNNYSELESLQKILFKYRVELQPYIINKSYGKYGDQRKKGVKLRNEICGACKKDVIGVPYNIVFDNQQNLLFHGFKSYQNNLPEDFISYLMTQ